MKNNLKALIAHIIIIILTFLFLIVFVSTGPKLGKYTTHILSRLLIVTGFILIYVFAGTRLDIDANKSYDFLSGSLIAIIGVLLWLYTISKVGWDLYNIPKELSEYWIMMNIYHGPFIFINFFFPLPNRPIFSLLMNLFPSLLIGIGLRYKRRIDKKDIKI